ncbi:hypothetical protein DITRI_Ditri08aG0118900 [Diplodiscus trichospermus]
MALHPLRIRRALTSLTILHRTLSVPNPTAPTITAPISNSIRTPPPSSLTSSFGTFQCRWFRSSGGPLSSPRQYKLYKEGDEITEDTILFEGCDYNHWLIVVDFPKDNKPPPEEMVRTYENICAQGLGISVEEAKKRIYACSTTTYEGFQVLMSEEESEKFNDIPGVIFVLPDSYIDPVKKEYGGDKYENGVITPRPPPIQYARNQGGRFRQHNRNPDQQRYDRQGNSMPNQLGNPPYNQQGFMQGDGRLGNPMPNQQGNPSYNQHGFMQGDGRQGNPMPNQHGNPSYNQQGFVQGDGRNYRPPQNYPPQQNFGQQPPMNNRDYAPRGSDPSYQGGFNQGGQGTYNSQERREFFQGDQRNYMPPEQRDFRGDHRNIVPPQGGNYGQGPSSGHGQNFGQGTNPGYGQNSGLGGNPGYRQSSGQGTNPGYGQNSGLGANPGYGHSYGQGSNNGFDQNYGPGATAGSGQSYGQGANPGYGQTYPGHGVGQGFSQAEQRDVQVESPVSMGQGGVQQGRY